MKFSSLLQHVTPHRNTLLLIVVLLIASSALALLNPWIAGLMTQSLLSPGDGLHDLRLILLGWLGLLALRSLLNMYSQYLMGTTGEKMAAGLRSRVYEHLQSLPLTYHHERRPGELLSLLGNDAQIISGFVTETVAQLLPQLCVFSGAIIMMTLLDPLIAALALVLLPVYFFAMKLLGRRIRPLSSRWIVAWSDMLALAQENLGLLPAIKAFAREQFELRRFNDRNRLLLQTSRQALLVQSLLTPSISFLAGAGLLLLLWIGILQFESGQIDAAALVSLLLYAMLLTQPVSGLANVYGQVMRTRGAADRTLELLEVQPEPIAASKLRLDRVEGSIEFRDVSFAYPGRAEVLHHFNLTIGAGETIALTGPNGAGKTTLVHLLMRFVEPSEGSILIDGMDIREFSLQSLRKQIGLVAQNTLLVNGTVAENICYGHPSASIEEMKKAAVAAWADAFIDELPDQYETLIGDQGVRLSGGQRQRLSLARTLLGNPPILILDEATAMFDPEGEKSFIAECHEMFNQRTVVLITHRPASLALADRILELKPHVPGK